MKQKYLLGIIGLTIVVSIGWIGAQAITINSSSFDVGFPTFKKVMFTLLGSEAGQIGVQLDTNGIYVSSEALPGTAGNIIRLGENNTLMKSTVQNSDITSGSIGSHHIKTGGVTAQDIGTLQITNNHIKIHSLSTGSFASDINFVSGGLFYFANGICQGTNGIIAITSGNVVCSPVPTGEGGNNIPCLEGQSPIMDANGQWTCQGILLGGEEDGDMYWNGTITGNISNANQSGFVGVGLTQPTETLHATQDVRIDGVYGSNSEIYCYKTDSRIPADQYSPADCAVCEKPGYVYNPATNKCEKSVCNTTGSVIHGVCGQAHLGTFAGVAPTIGLCLSGQPTIPHLSVNQTTWSRKCFGSDSAQYQTCWAQNIPSPIAGACGTANGQILSSAPSASPTSNLCAAGTPTTVAGTGPWSWQCQGLNGGQSLSCSADKAPDSCVSVAGQPCNNPNGYDTYGLGGYCYGYNAGNSVGTCSIGGNSCTSNTQCTTSNWRATITPSNTQYVAGNVWIGGSYVNIMSSPVNVYSSSGVLLGSCNFKELMGTPDSEWMKPSNTNGGYKDGIYRTRAFFADSNVMAGFNTSPHPSSCSSSAPNNEANCLNALTSNHYTINICTKASNITHQSFTSAIQGGNGTVYIYGSGSNWEWYAKYGGYVAGQSYFNMYTNGYVTSYTNVQSLNSPFMPWNGMLGSFNGSSGPDMCVGITSSTPGTYQCPSPPSCASSAQFSAHQYVTNPQGAASTFNDYRGWFMNAWHSFGNQSWLCQGVYANGYGPVMSSNRYLQTIGNGNMLYSWNCGSVSCNYIRSTPWTP